MDKDFSYKINSITKKVTVSGYACKYHDLENKVIRFNKGVFGNSISNTDFVKLLCLDKTKQPIGKITKIFEDDVGLFVEASINSHTEEGKEAQRLLITNGIEKISINFKINDLEVLQDGTKIIKNATLMHVNLRESGAGMKVSIIRDQEEKEEEEKEFRITIDPNDLDGAKSIRYLLNNSGNIEKTIQSSIEIENDTWVARDNNEDGVCFSAREEKNNIKILRAKGNLVVYICVRNPDESINYELSIVLWYINGRLWHITPKLTEPVSNKVVREGYEYRIPISIPDLENLVREQKVFSLSTRQIS